MYIKKSVDLLSRFFLSFGYERLKADMKISAFNAFILSTYFSVWV